METKQVFFVFVFFNDMKYFSRVLNNFFLPQMFFCISLGFVIAWAPYAVVSFLFIFHKGNWYMAPEGFVFPALFAKSSHIYNPFIYFYFNKTFQQELRHLFMTVWPRARGNRVGIHLPVANQTQCPIHIQLQERHCVPKKKKTLSQDRTNSKSKSKSKSKSQSKERDQNNGSRFLGRPVYVCWESTSHNVMSDLEMRPARESLPVSL